MTRYFHYSSKNCQDLGYDLSQKIYDVEILRYKNLSTRYMCKIDLIYIIGIH